VYNEKQYLEEELALVEAYTAFLDRRLSRAGLLIIPDEFVASYGSGDTEEPDFVQELMDALTQPVGDTIDTRFLPIILKGPVELTDKIRLIEFDRGIKELRTMLGDRANTLKSRIEEIDSSKEAVVE
jgi:hypothetical protein